MTNQPAIFIFTKDRPNTLNKTLTSIIDIEFTKYIVDDSTTSTNQELVSNLCATQSNCFYLGIPEFNNFIILNNIDFPRYAFLLRTMGQKDWNLGYVRNFALLYAKSINRDRVLFMDDDIQVMNSDLISKLFYSLEEYTFAGANIEGLVDDSALGHIATDLEIINERMLSGGFMVFNPEKIDQFFLNNYNEDWIWLFLQLKNKEYLQIGKVLQELNDPLLNYKTKILFQEFGEIALDGILDLYQTGHYDLLCDLLFWERLVKERKEYLNLLTLKAIKRDKKKYVEIIQWVQSNTTNFNAELFCQLFRSYFRNLEVFKKLFNTL